MIKSQKIIKKKKTLVLGSGAQKLDMGHLGLKGLSSYKSRTLAPISTNKTSIYPESYKQIIKS